MERGSNPRALRLQAVEVRDSLTGSRLAHMDAVCFQMVPGILGHDHAPEIASSDHKDVGFGGEDQFEIPDGKAVTVLSPPGADDAIGSDDDVGV
jgi:hypothetical protein